MISPNLEKSLLFATLVLQVSLICASAKIVKVYRHQGAPAIAEMRSIAESLKFAANGSNGSINGFQFFVSEADALSELFSVDPGESAYFWTDGKYEWTPSFRMNGRSMLFEGISEPLSKRSIDVSSRSEGFVEDIEVSAHSGLLRVEYEVASASNLILEVFGVNGKKLSRWNWAEIAAGRHSKQFTLQFQPNQARFARLGVNGRYFSRKVVIGAHSTP
jgi:hypothetical protein